MNLKTKKDPMKRITRYANVFLCNLTIILFKMEIKNTLVDYLGIFIRK